ncbi:dehydrogenase/reductase SDR family member 7 [Drosophila guanche]|uniref:Blast:Dehydrogenase/reductase SDR family member 7 n=1 Tax=Drosophila guanche TaxID=7266 RepID=A0A3B0K074_DROGU|nr:dehydrogenase/reductase SDR family member 7 [Drosophila guanche]SPP79359.1 blast:Dehydrogenase/reductase SDR family member 7 [Drosophila guanche]
MSFLEFLLILLVVYYAIYVLLWIVLDCNVALWIKSKFGVSLSSMRGQVVWITGASSGIGRSLALSLARHGVRLVLSARRVEQLEEVQKECLAAARGLLATKDVLILPMDMLQLQRHESNLFDVLNHFDRLDVLVNNAGRSQRASWTDIEIEVDRELFELDVFSVVHLTRLVVRYFVEQNGGRGHVAATSSIAGFGPVPFSATYCAAKHALNAYLLSLKLEMRKLDVTIFAPGPIATDFLQEAFTGEQGAKLGKSTANQKRMTAERCGELFAVALANKMDLTWCGLFPVNLLAYCARNPTLTKILGQFMTEQTLNKIREGKL